ncbi:MAG: hypothetical protein QXK80_03190 [Candidatus Pacearchaeota archaeon]
MNKKAAELSINTIIIIILALVALIVILLIFSGTMKEVIANLMTRIKITFGLWNETQIKP